jgi:predicted nucleic acid-binding protein
MIPPLLRVFADTSFWLAMVDRKDVHHARALNWANALSGLIITTRLVLVETANALSKVGWRQHAVVLIDSLAARDDVDIIDFSSRYWELAWQLYRDRPDKGWSLTDCCSFVVMHESGLSAALTADAHFTQAGFQPLLLADP